MTDSGILPDVPDDEYEFMEEAIKIGLLEAEIEGLRVALDKCRLVSGTPDAVEAIVTATLKQK